MKNILTALWALLIALAANAYSISGVVIDEQNGEPLPSVCVTLVGDSAVILKDTSTNGNGWFAINEVSLPEVFVGLSYMGYETQKIAVEHNGSDIDLGQLKLTPKSTMLNEVVVTAAQVVEEADKYVIIPSLKEIERAAETLSLLSELKVKMPGLNVDEAQRGVSIDGGAPVLQINGKETSLTKLEMINLSDILRIEYRNTPDIRYADRNVTGIINFVLKPRREGGSFMASVDEALNVLRSNISLSGTYYHKKSEWSLYYGNRWHRRTKQSTDIQEQFIGRENTIYRNQIGLPSTARDFGNNLSLEYTYMHDPNTMLSARIDYETTNVNFRDFNIIEQIEGNASSRYHKFFSSKSDRPNQSFDLYFRKNFTDKQSLELNAVGSTSSGKSWRGTHYTYQDAPDYNLTNFTDNSSWAAAAEGRYSISFKNLTTRVGINYRRNHAENNYAENGAQPEIDKLDRDDLFFYGELVGKIGKLGYTIGVGGKYFNNSTLSSNEHNLRFKTTATLNYRLNNHFSAGYLYMYSPDMPSLAAMTDDVRTIDDISLSVGNPYLRPSIWQCNRLMIRYNTGDFYATAWGRYIRTNSPITSEWYYDSDPASKYYQMFLNKSENGRYDDHVGLQLDLSYQNLFNHLTISATVGWDSYTIAGTGQKDKLNKAFARISANAYFGNWTIFASYLLAPQYSVYGQRFIRQTRNDYIGARFRWRNFNFSAMLWNPFTKKGLYNESYTLSKVHPYKESYCIKDFANMVELTIVYRVNFGKLFQKAQRNLHNEGIIDTGVQY